MTEEMAKYGEIEVIEVIDVMTRDDEIRFKELERIIERNMKGAFEWGTALMEIRGKKLYRVEYDRFEDYVKHRWDIGRRYANMLIEATQVVERLGTIVPLPQNEAQARPLTLIDPHEQPEAWIEVIKTAPKGKVTASHVKRIVMARIGQKTRENVDRTRRVMEHEVYDVRFKSCFNDFMQQVIEAVRGGWKSVPKATVRKHLEALLEAIR